jgi:hypothetical protein
MHTAMIPQDNTLTADHAGMVRIAARDREGDTLSLMLFTEQAAALRDALNAMDLGPRPVTTRREAEEQADATGKPVQFDGVTVLPDYRPGHTTITR